MEKMVMHRGKTVGFIKYLLILLIIVVLSKSTARSDVSLLQLGALGVSGEGTSAGHVSVYFSNICAETPVRLRLCKPGEMGVVLAYYPDLGTDKEYEWLAIPLLTYIYGVEEESRIPLYINGKVRVLLRETFRQNHLRSIVSDEAIARKPDGRWRELIGAIFNREIYSFTLKTTPDEDAAVVEKLNHRPNKKRFNLLYYNCADFSREIVNMYFPGSAHRDMLNDFTITTPKAITKSFAHYGSRHPERLFTVTRYSQLSGPIRRSMNPRNFSEHAIKSKKYLIPQLLLKQSLFIIFAAAYYTIGRFDPYQSLTKFGSEEIARLNLEAYLLRKNGGARNQEVSVSVNGDSNDNNPAIGRPGLKEIGEGIAAERKRLFGEKKIWGKYKTDFAPILRKAVDEGLFYDIKEVKTFFKDLELQSDPGFDEDGNLILRVRDYGEDHILGLTGENILSGQSHPVLAYKLLLAMIDAQLNASEKKREFLPSFEMKWNLMTQLSTRLSRENGTNGSVRSSSSNGRRRFLENPEKKTFKQKFQKIFVAITH